MDDKSTLIYSLIAAKLCSEKLSEEEEEQLACWKQAHPDNQKKYDYYQSIFDKKERLLLWEQVQTPPKCPEKIFNRVSRYRQLQHICIKYAAILIPAITVSLILLLNNSQQEVPVTEQPVAVNDIAPGHPQAILKTAKGEKIALSDSGMLINNGIRANSGKKGVLQYANGQTNAGINPEYHTLIVNRGCEYQLELPDGTKVWLNSGSELQYPSFFAKGERKVFLKGEAYFDVAHNKEQAFIVDAGSCNIRVLGTEFNVNNYQDNNNVVTTLVKGKIEFHTVNHKKSLTPGQQCIFKKTNNSTEIKTVNTAQYISWKNGLFIFDHIEMEELARQIARWYDVQVVFTDESLRSASFTGAMERYKPVSYIIRLLNETETVDCRLDNGILVFQRKNVQ